MIISRIFPKKSNYFKKLEPVFQNIGEVMDSKGGIRLFSFWTLIVAGIVLSMDFENRYVYWNWIGWELGFLKLLFATIIYFYLLIPNNLWSVGSKYLEPTEIMNHGIIAYLLLVFGNIRLDLITPDFVGLLPYVIAFLSCLCAFQFPLTLDEEKGTWNHFEWKNKNQYFCLSLVLMLISTFLGVYFDDPIMSTAGAVCIPFPLITLIWPNHVRHLQRARFFPLFTFSMFLCVRAPWFFFPLWILFFIIRTVNYFRFGIVYPSFGVDFLEE